MRELEAQAKALAPVIAGLVRRSVDEARQQFTAELAERDRQIGELKGALESAINAAADVEGIARQAAALVPTPENGKDADPDLVRQLVQEAVDAIPAPKDGRDADPEDIQRAVSEAMARVPTPKDGQSVTLDDVMPTLSAAVEKMLADSSAALAVALAAAEARMVEGLVEAAASLRQPADGQSVTLEDVQPVIDSAVRAIEVAADERVTAAVSVAAEAAQKAVDVAASLRQPEDGKSVTLEDVRAIVEEAVSRAVAALPAPKDGESVTLDDVSPLVVEAVRSAVSAIEIPRPRDGEHGRDAVHLEILPAIDEAKSYPRGSYAKHAGGLWRAYEATHAMRGWECIVDGIADHRIEQVDERMFEAVSVLSSGLEVRRAIAVPAVIDRGVFQAGAEYQAGDGVTWGGSYWIAQDASPNGKPGEPESKGWRLAVKRGDKGASAYQIAVKAGFQGTEREWMERIYTGLNPDRVVRVNQ